MSTLGRTTTRWSLALATALVAVSATALPADRGPDAIAPFIGAMLIVVAAAWYWSLEARIEPEVVPKLKAAGIAVLAVLLALLYGVLVAALGLPDGMTRFLYTLLLAAAAAGITVTTAALVDLSLLSRSRWGRHLAVALLAGIATAVVAATLGAHATGGSPLGAWGDLAQGPYLTGAAVAWLALIAPIERVMALDRRERVVVWAGWIGALVPLSVGASVGRLIVLEHQHLLLAAVRVGSIVCLEYLLVVMARAALALPGARAYERKTRELGAIYDFGLTASSAFNPQELQIAVLDSILRVAEPDVALLVEPDPGSPGCQCVLLRADSNGERVYRFGSRARWSALQERFADRSPVVIGDHGKTPPGVLARIWEPSMGSSIIVPVFTQDAVVRAVLIVGRFEKHAFNRDEVRSLAGFANQVALAIDHARLLRDTVEAERRKRELEIARELQINLLPKAAPEIEGLDIAARSEPATEVGGDYYDYLTSSNGALAVIVGDVAGHGMPAGLLMAMAKSAIHTLVRSGSSPPEVMSALNETLLEVSQDNQFMTLVFAEIGLESGELNYSNAGHHYPFHYRASTGEITELESTGLPLGMFPRPPGPFRRRPLGVGDILVFYSDGLVEAARADEEMFGRSRLRDLILANRNQDAETMVRAAFSAAHKFCGDEPFQDDATLVVVRITAAAATPGGEEHV